MSLQSLYVKKRILLMETILLVLVPLFLSTRYPTVMMLRHVLMVFGITYFYVMGRSFGITAKSLGLTRNNLRASMREVVTPTMIGAAIALAIGVYRADILTLRGMDDGGLWGPSAVRLILYVLLSVPLQELAFRGFVINRLSWVSRNSAFMVIYSSLIFGLIHLMFANWWIAVATFIVSIWWSSFFMKYKNVWPVIVSHGVLGCIVLLVTFGVL